jgi:hypothetical protein
MQRELTTFEPEPIWEQLAEVPYQEWHVQLHRLQQIVCELLIKNQQLRLKLAIDTQDARKSEATAAVEWEVSRRERPPVSGFLET